MQNPGTRVLLQNNVSAYYFCRGDYWTPRFKDARDFGSIEHAEEFSRSQNLMDVQIVVIEDRSDSADFLAPVNQEPAPEAESRPARQVTGRK